MIDSKWCPKCETEKSVLEFHLDRARPDGHQLWCKDCCRERDRARPRQRRTVTRLLRVRANNRAMAALRDRHREEFEELFLDCMASVIEQAEVFRAGMPQQQADDDVLPLLKPGPAVPSEPIEERWRVDDGSVTSCPSCRVRHDHGHRCPVCGSKPQVSIRVGMKNLRSTA